MQPVAVGRFDEHHVGLAGNGLRVAQDGTARHAEVAREDQATVIPSLTHMDVQPGRTEDMTGVMEAGLDAASRFEALSVRDGTQLLEHGVGLSDCIERRLDHAFVFACPALMAQLPFTFLFLDVRAVGKQDAKQIHGGRRGVDRATKAHHREARQEAGMVDVGVGEKDKIETAHIKAKAERMQVFGARFGPTLKHPAIDNKTNHVVSVTEFNQGARSSDFACRAVKADAHRRSPRRSDALSMNAIAPECNGRDRSHWLFGQEAKHTEHGEKQSKSRDKSVNHEEHEGHGEHLFSFRRVLGVLRVRRSLRCSA